MCRSMVDIQSPTAEIRRGKKKKEEDRKIERNYRMKILWSALLHRATIINSQHTTAEKQHGQLNTHPCCWHQSSQKFTYSVNLSFAASSRPWYLSRRLRQDNRKCSRSKLHTLVCSITASPLRQITHTPSCLIITIYAAICQCTKRY